MTETQDELDPFKETLQKSVFFGKIRPLRFGEGVLGITLLLILATYAFEGILRFGLMRIGLLPVIYLRDAFFVGILGILSIRIRSVNLRFVLFFCVLAASALIGLKRGQGMTQVAFGVKIFLPVMAAGFIPVSAWQLALRSTVLIRRGILFLLIFGLVWDYLADVPWGEVDRESISVGGETVEVVNRRTWMNVDTERCAGFSRSSYDAAAALMILAMLEVGYVSFGWMICVFFFSAVGIYLTTSKAPLLAFMSAVLVVLIFSVVPRWQSRVVCVAVSSFSMALLFLAPLLSLSFSHFSRDNLSGSSEFFLGSLGDRITESWPESISRIRSLLDLLMGVGVGGVGTPQKLFDWENYLPVDNFPLFMILSFGIGGILFALQLTFPLFQPFYLRRVSVDWIMNYAILLMFALYGVSACAIDQPLLIVPSIISATYLYCSKSEGTYEDEVESSENSPEEL